MFMNLAWQRLLNFFHPCTVQCTSIQSRCTALECIWQGRNINLLLPIHAWAGQCCVQNKRPCPSKGPKGLPPLQNCAKKKEQICTNPKGGLQRASLPPIGMFFANKT